MTEFHLMAFGGFSFAVGYMAARYLDLLELGKND